MKLKKTDEFNKRIQNKKKITITRIMIKFEKINEKTT
jgi:hypothetical protein